ncbi:MAG: alpha/beta fold hydrolase, partial [Acidobacteriota bacterium]
MTSSTRVSSQIATRACIFALVCGLSLLSEAEEAMHQQTFRLAAAGEPALFLRHQRATATRGAELGSVLYIHGATFPSALSVAFEFDGYSWMDDLSAAGFSVWALDFAGYGGSDRYSLSSQPSATETIPGRSEAAADQIDRAVGWILDYTGAARISLVAHSWGTIVAGRYAGENPDRIDRLVLFGPIAQREQRFSDEPLSATRLVSIEDQHARFVKDVPPNHSPVL